MPQMEEIEAAIGENHGVPGLPPALTDPYCLLAADHPGDHTGLFACAGLPEILSQRRSGCNAPWGMSSGPGAGLRVLFLSCPERFGIMASLESGFTSAASSSRRA